MPSPSSPPSSDDTTPTPDASPETQRAIAACQEFLDLYIYIAERKNLTTFDDYLMRNMRIITASGQPGNQTATPPTRPSASASVLAELVMPSHYINITGHIHGGATSTIFDMATAMAMCPVQRPGYWDFMGGVTRTLNISCLKGFWGGRW